MNVSRTPICGALLLFTLMSGVGLSLSEKPLDDIAFSIHRLSALLTVIVIVVIVYPLFTVPDVRAYQATHHPASALLFLTLFVSGVLPGSGSPERAATLAIYRVMALLALAATAGMSYQLARRSFS